MGTSPQCDAALKASRATERRAVATAGFAHANTECCSECSNLERVNSRQKDSFGGRYLRVCGQQKAST